MIIMETTTTVQIYKSDLAKLNDIADRAQPLRDVIRNILVCAFDKLKQPSSDAIFETATVPANGRVRLTKAGGKTIEWRIKE